MFRLTSFTILLLASRSLIGLAAEAVEKQQEVVKFIQSVRPPSLHDRFGRDELEPVKLVITTFEELKDIFFGEERTSRAGIKVSESGLIGGFYYGPRGSKGGGYPQLPASVQQRVEELLSDLPADVDTLPMPDRCLLVQVADGERFVSHLYDRADPPEAVLELLRITGSGLRTWSPEYKSEATIKIEGIGGLSITPDGKHLLTNSYGTLKLYEIPNLRLVKEEEVIENQRVEGLFFTPGGKHLIVSTSSDLFVLQPETWEQVKHLPDVFRWHSDQSIFPHATPDGLWLLAGYGYTKEGVLRTYDMEYWRKRDGLPGLPDHLRAYFPAAKKKRALIVPERFSIALYNVDEMSESARLDRDAILLKAAFSPDETQIAIVTKPSALRDRVGCDIRVWDVESGKLLRKLLPYEQTTCDTMEWIGWSADGKHVLAATKAHRLWTSRDICVWHATSGRHRGVFTGPSSKIVGVALTRDSRELFAAVEHSGIHRWDFNSAMTKIQEFEASLSR